MDGVGHGGLARGGGRPPCVALANQRPLVDQPADDLLEEERIALSLGQQFLAEVTRDVRDGQETLDETGPLLLREWSKRDRRRVLPAGGEPGVHLGELRPRRRHDDERTC